MRPDPRWLAERSKELRRDETSAEGVLWDALRAKRFGGFKFRRQHTIGRFIVDFVCNEASLVVEVDGPTHDEAKDAQRDLLLSRAGYKVVRINNQEVYENLEGVLEFLWNELHRRAPR